MKTGLSQLIIFTIKIYAYGQLLKIKRNKPLKKSEVTNEQF